MLDADWLPVQAPDMLTQGNPARAEVALTFDDGPCVPYTLQILDILRFYQAQATFFCLGKNVGLLPTLAARMCKEGHLVENHTWSHPVLPEIADTQILSSELTRCTEAITEATGVRPAFFRPPYGKYDSRVVTCCQAHQLRPVLWTIDSRDWLPSDADAICANVIGKIQRGAIILFHDGEGDRSSTVEALPRLIAWIQQHQFHLVTLRQLLS